MSNHLRFIVDHVFLPPQLPQKDDSDSSKDQALINALLAALKSYQTLLPSTEERLWLSCIGMVEAMIETRDEFGGLMATQLEQKLQTLRDEGILLLYIRGQNAGVIVRRSLEQISIESFEVAPENKSVTQSKGRLLRSFPGPAVVIARSLLSDPKFCEPLVACLVSLDSETPEEAQPTVTKSGSKTVETRDTVDPRFVSEMLTGFLRAVGQPLDVSRIAKCTREEVLWDDALKPWRRSPLWLLLRVALQTSFMCRKQKDVARLEYKSFMVFFMACLLSKAFHQSFPNQLLFTMTAKIARRVLKLGPAEPTPSLTYAQSQIQAVHTRLTTKWNELQKMRGPHGIPRAWTSSPLNTVQDTQLTLSSLLPYLKKTGERHVTTSLQKRFIPNCPCRITFKNVRLPDTSVLKRSTGDELRLCLADLEHWVYRSLQEWLAAKIGLKQLKQSCTDLKECIDDYTKAASYVYLDAPEEVSNMFLTTMDLWVALDKCSLLEEPILQDYDPRFLPSLFDPLILPKKHQMRRLLSIEQYLVERKRRARPLPSVFSSFGLDDSLPVRYYNQSSAHQHLRQRIEDEALKEQTQKIAEFERRKTEYDALIHEAGELEHTHIRQSNRWGEQEVHSKKCRKCALPRQARSMTIDVYEWPMPKEDLKVRAVVFELNVPIVVSKWRDATYTIRIDVLGTLPESSAYYNQSSKQRLYFLHDYDGLRKYVGTPAGRLQLGSIAKSFLVAHYKSQKVGEASRESICKNHNLQYDTYDSISNKCPHEMSNHDPIRTRCTPKLPVGSFQALQHALANTTHTSNQVIADQSQHPVSLTLHESYAFVTLRSGHRLQWRNIARELVARVLNFSREETYMMIAQAIGQAGPLGDSNHPLRESHIDLECKAFGISMLSELWKSFSTVEANWQGASAARTFTVLTARILSLTPHISVESGCLQLLRKARAIALLWMRELGRKLRDGPVEVEIKSLRLQMLEMALTCHETFDVDLERLPVLLSANEDVATLTEVSITIHDLCPALASHASMVVRALLRRHWRRMHLLESVLREQISRCGAGLDNTVQRLWAGYRPCNPWTALATPNERWLMTRTSGGDNSKALLVHYNLLDGSLLVNGSPLTRVPLSYEADPSYRRLFGERVLDVVPSTEKGMLFETREKLFGQQIYFSMHESKLIIRAKKFGRYYELIPIDAFGRDFPCAFVNDFAHWLDLDERTIEWRPLTCPWDSSITNWRMREGGNQSLKLTRDSLILVDSYGPTAKALTSIFSPLETTSHIHIMIDHDSGQLEVHMPRLKLDFFMSKGTAQLESKQCRGMFVDQDQSIGTLTGLVNKLILRGKAGSSRLIIIPHGEVSFAQEDQHVRVQIKPTERHSYHIYTVDQVLGRLVDNGSLKSKLLLCYLHAVTSNCLADTLTSRTGTEEALNILRSASIHSFLRLEEEEIEILKQISHLTPVREYYPPGLRVMHRVHWITLPPLSQHHAFDGLARSILRQAASFNLFDHGVTKIAELRGRGEEDLLTRAAIRNSTYCVYSFGAEDHTKKFDQMYAARDAIRDGDREYRVYRIAKLVDRWSQDLCCTKDLLSRITTCGLLVYGNDGNASLVLGFHLQWLASPAQLLPTTWCTLQTRFSMSPRDERYKNMLCLSTLSYSGYWDAELLETLLAFATIPELRDIIPPNHVSFDLSHGFGPEKSKLLKIALNRAREYHLCPEYQLPSLPNESSAAGDSRRRQSYQANRDYQVEIFVKDVTAQWPATTVRAPSDSDLSTYINVKAALDDMQDQFRFWHQNTEFQSYVRKAQTVLNSCIAHPRKEQRYSYPPGTPEAAQAQSTITVGDLLNEAAPSITLSGFGSLGAWTAENDDKSENHDVLKLLLVDISSTSMTGFEQRYIRDLAESFVSLCKHKVPAARLRSQSITTDLQVYVHRCEKYLYDIHRALLNVLEAAPSITLRISLEAKIWPRLSRLSLLQWLANAQKVQLADEWKTCLVRYGIVISQYQHAQRLIAAIGKETELMNELRNSGRQGWDPMIHPDWLLLEIENSLCIRSNQAQIAQEMIAPALGSNSVLQLNMGEGKSSVIVPIVAATLADTKKLVRVLVLKPLAPQMFQSLVMKLGGLLNRRVFYIPFSRSVRLDVQETVQIRQLYEECMSSGDVLLAQPEHLLSFELMGPERLLSDDPVVGKAMVATQQWLDTHSRDILDESDEILSVRYELCYTMGKQAMIEFSPDRWLIIEHVLGLVHRFACQVLREFPEGLEISATCPGSFPRIRVLQAVAGEHLTTLVASHICNEGMPGLNVWSRGEDVRKLLFKYLTDVNMSETDAEPLQSGVIHIESAKKTLQLLRGLVAGRVLAFAFEQKRWRVNYGLDLSRTKLSVPYRAKDMPAERAEFSHPDTTILLTCLSYYYGGLSNQDLYCAFEVLLLSDQAQDEFDHWVHDAPTIPSAFRQLIGINLSDQIQCHERVFPCLRFAKGAIDFYMSRIVFPREMQEFPEKLSSSGWDIAKEKGHPLTGFSGTNDSRYILPLSVNQRDLPEQLHTNAGVLSCLLRPENTFQHSMLGAGRETFNAESLLRLAVNSDPPVRVILDVGAQVLELTNQELVRSWLMQTDPTKAQAAIFLDDRNEISVMSRDWTIEPLLISPFAKQMDQCLVYLDESHTRGTDLKLPTDYRAAVTLGPNLTKDRLVQACMRMRKLGKGQSVMFCAPKEVECKILKCAGKSNNPKIEVADVLRWSIQETCTNTAKCVPLWAVQGLRHQHRELAWPKSLDVDNTTLSMRSAKRLLEPEAKSLEQRYGLAQQGPEDRLLLHGANDESLKGREGQVQNIRDKCREFGVHSFSSTKLQEEQERELSPENEKERELERPHVAKPLSHSVHQDVRRFIVTGILDRTSAAFQPAFSIMKRTSAGKHLEKKAWLTRLLVTSDFAQTIEATEGQHLDDYLRPVHWIATRRYVGTPNSLPDAVILSPFEANELLPFIRSHGAVTLHAYSPRVNMSVRSLEDLSFCAVPPFLPQTLSLQPLVMELNLFAGQSYLSGHEEYLLLCRFLGLASSAPKDGVGIQGDGFVEPAHRALQDAAMARECRFQRTPVEFLRVLMAMRRKGQDFKRSHMGALLHGELLAQDRFGR